ncbi:MAG: DUF2934 domain-containing protein [Phycisphaerales bacterium]
MPRKSNGAATARRRTTVTRATRAMETPAVTTKSPEKMNERKPNRSAGGKVTREQIAAKAYELWQTRGGEADFNWYEAERMLNGPAR